MGARQLVLPLGALVAIALGGCGGTIFGTQDAGLIPPDLAVEEPDAGRPPSGCSGDLRQVLDADDNVLETCATDQGCADGRCVPACEAAAHSTGNVGCDFLVGTPPAYATTPPPCFAVFLANTWSRAAQLQVSRGGQRYDVTRFARRPIDGQPPAQWPLVDAAGVPAGGGAVLFLSSDPNAVFPENGVNLHCPVETAVGQATMVVGTGIGSAFRIESDTPLSAYDILPFGGARSHFPSAEILFPTSAWGTNYVVMAAPAGTADSPGPQWGQIVAAADATTITILPRVALPPGNNLAGAPAGMPATYHLDAGAYLQWQFAGARDDWSGSIIQSDKPIAVATGNQFLRLQPTPGPGGESSHHHVVPVSALASEYVAAPYATRRADLAPEDILYRVVGIVDGTQLTFDPPAANPAVTVAKGQVLELRTPLAFRLTSQDDAHPFEVAQMMDTANLPGGSRPGITVDFPGLDDRLGDEEFVVMLPPAQFLSRYGFFADLSFGTTSLALTRVKDGGAFHDVTVDCLGVVGGWQPAGSDGRFEVTTVDLVRAGTGVGSCRNGLHHADSDGPFGVVVWGLDTYASYAYPAGGNAARRISVIVPPIQ